MTGDSESTGGDGSRGSSTVRACYEWSATLPSMAVVETVAVAVDSDPVALEPLYESVDPDALDALVQSSVSAGRETAVSFPFGGRQVEVRSTGDVVVRDGRARGRGD